MNICNILTFLIVFALVNSVLTSWDHVVHGTELVFAFMVHRHGDRTPTPGTLSIIKNKDDKKIDELIKPWGLGQLTDVGKRTGFMTGQFIRRRYNDIIDDRYNRSEIYIRSTDSTRTKMTALTAMSAVFPAVYNPWNNFMHWTPTPYTTVPLKYDFNEAFINCPIYLMTTDFIKLLPYPEMEVYKNLLKKVSKLIGVNIINKPSIISLVHDLLQSLLSLGYDIGHELKELMPQITEASGKVWEIETGNKNNLDLQAGVLLKEFFDNSRAIIAGADTQKVRIYSAHDFNVFSFEAITQAVPLQGAPHFGSLFSLELRRVKESGQYVVLPVYLADPHDGREKYLRIDGCGDGYLCDYDTFYKITSSFVLDEDAWRKKCGFSEDMVINTASVD